MEVFELSALTPGIYVLSKRRIRQSKTRYPLYYIHYFLNLESLLDYGKDERGKRNYVTGKQIRKKVLVLHTTMYPGNNGHNIDDEDENEVSDENEGSVSNERRGY